MSFRPPTRRARISARRHASSVRSQAYVDPSSPRPAGSSVDTTFPRPRQWPARPAIDARAGDARVIGFLLACASVSAARFGSPWRRRHGDDRKVGAAIGPVSSPPPASPRSPNSPVRPLTKRPRGNDGASAIGHCGSGCPDSTASTAAAAACPLPIRQLQAMRRISPRKAGVEQLKAASRQLKASQDRSPATLQRRPRSGHRADPRRGHWPPPRPARCARLVPSRRRAPASAGAAPEALAGIGRAMYPQPPPPPVYGRSSRRRWLRPAVGPGSRRPNHRYHRCCGRRCRCLRHDPEKWVRFPKDHAQTINWSAMAIRPHPMRSKRRLYLHAASLAWMSQPFARMCAVTRDISRAPLSRSADPAAVPAMLLEDGAQRNGFAGADQRVGPARPIRSLTAVSNWLAEAAIVNLASS